MISLLLFTHFSVYHGLLSHFIGHLVQDLGIYKPDCVQLFHFHHSFLCPLVQILIRDAVNDLVVTIYVRLHFFMQIFGHTCLILDHVFLLLVQSFLASAHVSWHLNCRCMLAGAGAPS